MVNYFDRIYTSIVEKHKCLTTLRYYSFLRLIIRLSANSIIPLVYLLTRKNANYSLSNNTKTGANIIVSLTSFPARIARIWIVIESLLRQTKKPDRIILWLSREQFKTISELPKKLLKQTNRGLEIRLVDGDIRSHKKYYYVLKEHPNDFILTVDDDIIYRTIMIEDLEAYSNRYQGAVISQYCKEIMWSNDKLLPYNSWHQLKKEKNPGSNIFFGTGGGTLFPPGSINSMALRTDLFLKLTPTADDVWLNAMCQLNNTLVVNTKYYSSLLPVITKRSFALSEINNGLYQNDTQIKALVDYFKENGNHNPFKRNV